VHILTAGVMKSDRKLTGRCLILKKWYGWKILVECNATVGDDSPPKQVWKRAKYADLLKLNINQK